jgi:hypothetical protein
MSGGPTNTSQSPTTGRPNIPDSAWISGINTLLFPGDIQQGEYAYGYNIINRGGVVQTRPSKRLVFSFPGSRLQGAYIFQDANFNFWKLIIIDGYVFASQYPFKTYIRLNLRFNPWAPIVYFAQGIQSATYEPSGNIAFIEPIYWAIFQDGTSNPGWWDPISGRAIQKPVVPRLSGAQPVGYVPSLPIGTVMIFVDNRLWLAVGNQVYASDISNPLAFLEGTYLSQSDAFNFGFPVLCMSPAPEDTGLYVLTAQSLGQLQSQIQDRTQWQSTPNFQSTLSSEIGGSAPNGAKYAHGLLWIYSNKGLVSLNNALLANITSTLYAQDGEMARSRNRLSADRSGVTLGLFENLLLCAVPYCSLYNRETWIMDGDIASMLMSQIPPCWTAIWSGTWPVNYMRLIDNGVEHIYEASYSQGTRTDPITGESAGIHVWENISPSVNDDLGNGYQTPILCKWESRMILMPNEQYQKFSFIELYLVGIKGLVNLQVWYAGMAGLYNQIGTAVLESSIGPFGNTNYAVLSYQVTGTPSTELQSFKSQLRYMRGPEIVAKKITNSPHIIETGGIQSPNTARLDGVDKGFQIMLRWQGRLGFRKLKVYWTQQTETSVGAPFFPNETGQNNIVFDSADLL